MNFSVFKWLIFMALPCMVHAMEQEQAHIDTRIPVLVEALHPFPTDHLLKGFANNDSVDLQSALTIRALCGAVPKLDWDTAVNIVHWAHTHKVTLKENLEALYQAFLQRSTVKVYNADRSLSVTLDPAVTKFIPEEFRDESKRAFILPFTNINSLLLFQIFLYAQYNWLSNYRHTKPRKIDLQTFLEQVAEENMQLLFCRHNRNTDYCFQEIEKVCTNPQLSLLRQALQRSRNHTHDHRDSNPNQAPPLAFASGYLTPALNSQLCEYWQLIYNCPISEEERTNNKGRVCKALTVALGNLLGSFKHNAAGCILATDIFYWAEYDTSLPPLWDVWKNEKGLRELQERFLHRERVTIYNLDKSAHVHLPKDIVTSVPYLRAHQAMTQGPELVLTLESHCSYQSLVLVREMLHAIHHSGISVIFDPSYNCDSQQALELIKRLVSVLDYYSNHLPIDVNEILELAILMDIRLIAYAVVEFVYQADEVTKKEFLAALPANFIEILTKNISNYPMLLDWLLYHLDQPHRDTSVQEIVPCLLEHFAEVMPSLIRDHPALIRALRKLPAASAALLTQHLKRKYIFTEAGQSKKLGRLMEQYRENCAFDKERLLKQSNARCLTLKPADTCSLTRGASICNLHRSDTYMVITNRYFAYLITNGMPSLSWPCSDSRMKMKSLDATRAALVCPTQNKVEILTMPVAGAEEPKFGQKTLPTSSVNQPSAITMLNNEILVLGGADGITFINWDGHCIRKLNTNETD